MFAGIGGFRAGLSLIDGYECVGHCEIDGHADRSYRAIHIPKEREVFYPDARTLDPDGLPDIDLLCGGFPCQSFSLAGKRRGFDDARGTLFFEIARLAQKRRPAYLLLENVPGLLSHDKGRTFATILATLCDLGYGVEWQVLNSKDFGVPQSRRRVFLVGYLDARCAGKILPVREANGKALVQLIGGSHGERVYDPAGLSCTLTADTGGLGGKTGLYVVGYRRQADLATTHGPEDPLRPSSFVDLARDRAKLTDTVRCLTSNYGKSGVGNHKAESSGVLLVREGTKKGYSKALPGYSIDIGFLGSKTRAGRVNRAVAHDVAVGGNQGIMTVNGRIRRLTPRECLRLQGFTEDQIDRVLAITSDSQTYKQAGNSVTVNVIYALGLRIKAVDDALKTGNAP
jgi:DNA (cytosine-5)-methyltransferase 1